MIDVLIGVVAVAGKTPYSLLMEKAAKICFSVIYMNISPFSSQFEIAYLPFMSFSRCCYIKPKKALK